jgi:glycine oxidase
MIESASEAPVTIRSTLEMLSAAYSLHRGFSEANLLHTYTGLRAALPHNEPRIQVTSGKIVINGLFRHGFMLAPSLARCLRLIIEEKPIPHGGRLLSSE